MTPSIHTKVIWSNYSREGKSAGPKRKTIARRGQASPLRDVHSGVLSAIERQEAQETTTPCGPAWLQTESQGASRGNIHCCLKARVLNHPPRLATASPYRRASRLTFSSAQRSRTDSLDRATLRTSPSAQHRSTAMVENLPPSILEDLDGLERDIIHALGRT